MKKNDMVPLIGSWPMRDSEKSVKKSGVALAWSGILMIFLSCENRVDMSEIVDTMGNKENKANWGNVKACVCYVTTEVQCR